MVKLDTGMTGGTGYLCIGVFQDECPAFTGPLPTPIDGDDHGTVTLENDTQEEAFDFEIESLTDGTYGLAAMLQLSDGVSDCNQQPVSGDVLGCLEVTVSGGADQEDLEIVLDTAIP